MVLYIISTLINEASQYSNEKIIRKIWRISCVRNYVVGIETYYTIGVTDLARTVLFWL